jgi:hypothetical protein
MQTYSSKSTEAYQIREETIDEVNYLIAPVVMMVEGVHKGSHGALYHPATELSKSASFWEGIPVVINHPQDTTGNYISVNEVQNLIVGKVCNPKMDKDKLKAEIHLNVDKTGVHSPTTIASLKANKVLEVSIGVFTDEIKEAGEWNGETYVARATNHKPDHLAILPNDVGACSVNDGCGIRVNKLQTNNKEGMTNEDITIQNSLLVDFRSLQANELTYNDIQDLIWDKLYAMKVEDSQGREIKTCWSEAIYDDYLIYRENTKSNTETITKFYQQDYRVTKEGQIEFIDNPVEVVKELKYKVAQTNKEGGQKMAEVKTPCPKGTICKEAKVEALIANKLTAYTLEDKEMLMGLDEAIIDKMTPIEVEPVIVNKEVEVVKEVPVVYKTAEEFINAAPKDIQESLRSGLVLNAERKANLVQSILANSAKDSWTEDELKGMDTGMLEKLSKTYPAPVNYGANGQQAFSLQTNTSEMMFPAGVNVTPKKD